MRNGTIHSALLRVEGKDLLVVIRVSNLNVELLSILRIREVEYEIQYG